MDLLKNLIMNNNYILKFYLNITLSHQDNKEIIQYHILNILIIFINAFTQALKYF